MKPNENEAGDREKGVQNEGQGDAATVTDSVASQSEQDNTIINESTNVESNTLTCNHSTSIGGSSKIDENTPFLGVNNITDQ